MPFRARPDPPSITRDSRPNGRFTCARDCSRKMGKFAAAPNLLRRRSKSRARCDFPNLLRQVKQASRQQLLDFDLGAFGFELLLDLVRFRLGDAFLKGLRSAFNE